MHPVFRYVKEVYDRMPLVKRCIQAELYEMLYNFISNTFKTTVRKVISSFGDFFTRKRCFLLLPLNIFNCKKSLFYY